MKIEIKNWDDFQTFRKGRPKDTKWIKVHTSILTDYHFGLLSERNQLALIKLWLITDRSSGMIEISEDEILHKTGCKSIDFNALRDFITVTKDPLRETARDCAKLRGTARDCGLEVEVEVEVEKRRVHQIGGWFDQFWNSYPRKVSKSKSKDKFEKVIASGVKFSDIMNGLDASKNSKQWAKDGGQFIPHPTTWLNNERWCDEDTGNNNLTGEVPRMEGLGL